MKADVLLGLQWGDEGKGKVVDVLTPKYDIIARFQGGPNAGHTLEFEGIKHVLHTIPSGIFRSNKQNVVGNGVVIDPIIFKKEIDALQVHQVDVHAALKLSRKAHLILPTHRMLDAASEQAKGTKKIGSTLKGIGPTYMDKTGRNGLRIGDTENDNFKTLYEQLRNKHYEMLKKMEFDTSELPKMEKEWFNGIDFIKTIQLIDSEHYINNSLNAGQRVLAEGAQGSMLDIDFGSYPYVTSSNTICAGSCTGLGVPPSKIGDVFGIFKAYCTRVGSGPFPTELFNDTGKEIAKIGNEFGATTGRPRRCGWLDIPALKYAVMLNGVTHLIMTKADVLSGFKEIQVCTHYKYRGEVIDFFPYDIQNFGAEPIFKKFKGWGEDLRTLKSYEDFPESFKIYVSFLEKELGVPITMISTGPDRKDTLVRDEAILN
ncbi:MAG TPA: adenylosuccinate synthase [Flavobacteriales bacterium]|jgi:adenylosuccinate synthase|nr:adenylosuccinate synthase [Flavobacteriales bacterium]